MESDSAVAMRLLRSSAIAGSEKFAAIRQKTILSELPWWRFEILGIFPFSCVLHHVYVGRFSRHRGAEALGPRVVFSIKATQPARSISSNCERLTVLILYLVDTINCVVPTPILLVFIFGQGLNKVIMTIPNYTLLIRSLNDRIRISTAECGPFKVAPWKPSLQAVQPVRTPVNNFEY